MRTIDLNCDMGEGFGAYRIGDDAAMMEIITSANVACGFHAGDPVVMRDTIRLAKAKGVSIGAHPSFMDLYGFGRRRIAGETPSDIEAQVIYQIAAIAGMARTLGWPISHVKPHGTLYTMAAEDRVLSEACVRAVRAVDPGLVFVTLPFSETLKAAEAAGLTTACEVFADRRYLENGMLMPRGQEGAVIEDLDRRFEQVLSIVKDGRLPVRGGGFLEIEAATICIHGDTPGAPATARALRERLTAEGVDLAPFARPPIQTDADA
ncbi:LamB/YcsF family protein [Rhizobium sp. YIM 134829]|uniref:LamB/YcsF family protein n=1 Tax=Rhizobium sp. YIM 134829 TaxID=3390453 RepID=UPI00397B6912